MCRGVRSGVCHYSSSPSLPESHVTDFVALQRIALACLLGGVPLASLMLELGFCIYIRKHKKELREHALANGIELDEEGWPPLHTQRVVSPAASSRLEQKRDARSFSSYKGPSFYFGNPHAPSYEGASTQVPASRLKALHLAIITANHASASSRTF
jgi:hypothetical protein